MQWFSNLSDGFHQSFASLPKWSRNILVILIWLSTGSFMVVTVGEMTYATVKRVMPVAAEDIQSAQRRVELEKLEAEAGEARLLVMARTQTEREMEQAKAESHRASLGLQPRQSSEDSVKPLAALVQVATANLPTILLLMFAAYFLPVFASSGEHWRLILIVALLVVLAGAFSLATNVASLTKVEVRYKDFLATTSSASLAFYLMIFGVLLSAFPLYMLERHRRTAPTKLTDEA